MKKTHFLLLFICFSASIANCQTKSIKISTIKIGTINCEYIKSIDTETSDTMYFTSFSFQNIKYKSFADIRYITFIYKDQLSEFLDDLKAAEVEMKKSQNLTWDRQGYSFMLDEKVKNLVVGEQIETGSGYTLLTNPQVTKLISWINSIDFGKDKLISK